MTKKKPIPKKKPTQKTIKTQNKPQKPTKTYNKLSIAKVTLAIPGSYGIILRITERLNCDRSNFYAFMEKHPVIRKLINSEADKIVDVAEDKMMQLVKRGDTKMIERILKTKGRSRGYGDHVEQEVSGEQEFTFKWKS